MKPIAENKRANFDYEIIESFEAGIELTGIETKSAKMGRANLQGSHAIIDEGEIFLMGLHISPFQSTNTNNEYSSDRKRKLLLKKKEIIELFSKLKTGLTLIPLRMYTNKRGFIKILIGLGKGKKQYDKREAIKKRDTEREIRAEFKY